MSDPVRISIEIEVTDSKEIDLMMLLAKAFENAQRDLNKNELIRATDWFSSWSESKLREIVE